MYSFNSFSDKIQLDFPFFWLIDDSISCIYTLELLAANEIEKNERSALNSAAARRLERTPTQMHSALVEIQKAYDVKTAGVTGHFCYDLSRKTFDLSRKLSSVTGATPRFAQIIQYHVKH